MIALETFLQKLRKKMKEMNTVSDGWKRCSFAEKYDIDEFALAKKTLTVFVLSGIIKKDIEMNSPAIIRELNGKIPAGKAVRAINVKVRRR